MPKLWAIPDIHGRYDLLKALLDSLRSTGQFDPHGGDKLIFLGDMIDRGPDSKSVVDFIRTMVTSDPAHYIALAGNHEWLAIDACKALDGHTVMCWIQNGGDRTLQSYKRLWAWTTGAFHDEGLLPGETWKWLASLPLFREEPGFFFSHAPVPREEDRSFDNKGKPFTKSELTWTYEYPEDKYARDFGGGTVGVCGHVHQLRHGVQAPRLYPHYIFADAGCGCLPTAPLVAIEVQSRTVVAAGPEGVKSA